MTEKEMIEEMVTKQILALTQDLSDCLEYDIEDSSVVDTYDTAYKLVNKGWIKPTEGSVVLSKEEYLNDFNNQFNKGYKHGSKGTAKEILGYLIESGVINTAPETIKMYFKENYGVEL